MLTDADWLRTLTACGVRASTAAEWAGPFAEIVTADRFSQGRAEMDDFLGQILHESWHLTRLSENLSYSAERLMEVWQRRFPTLAHARPYARNPELLANYVYADRLGNIEPGDGWRFRGRSPIQITGRANYALVGGLVGQDLTWMPELLEQPRFALEACIAWWEDRIPDSMLGDPERITRRVNGGLIGLAEREHLMAQANAALGAERRTDAVRGTT